ncbi:DUF4214 domain-containing protein [uncultured Massilia sp.]|uniref:DUF4214 domain-containing protein n=1 Tax=uncultured Massilia sp. TaxID=169973 RepID=UPI0025D85A13|nr:DUF4214 domain-containing protein [uncultured Massilia sp.]
MATISDITTIPLSGLRHIDALLDSGPDWNFLTPADNVLRYTFSIAAGNEANTTGQEAFTASQQAATRSALAYLSSLTGIQFVETANGNDADVHLCNLNLTPSNVTGLCSWHSSYEYSGNLVSSYTADAYVYLDNVEWRAQNMNLAPGTQGYETLLHELGHALGLKHPFDIINGNATDLPPAQDNTANTLMSYTDAGGPYATFQQYDIAALNWLYGGDGLRGALGINSTTGGRYITGTGGADTLTGTAANDKLEGDGGNDMIDGGAGTDTAVFRGARSNYTFSQLANGDVQVTSKDGIDGTDILRSVELYQFGGDGAVRADTVLGDTTPPAAPQLVVTQNGNGYVSNKNPSVTGSAEANATIKIYTTDNLLVGTAVTDANGLWTARLDAFADGLGYKIYAVATDASGNTSTSSAIASFNVDATAPIVPTASLSFSGANTATLRGTGEAGTEIQLWRLGATLDDALDIAHATVGADGTWSIATSPLPNGQYSLRPVSIDKAGNATSADTLLTLTVDSSLNLAGTGANDRLVAPGAGDNAIDGQAGLDTVVYAGTRSNYTVAKEVWGYGVTDKTGNGGHDAVLNVERLEFSDGNIALDVDGNAGQIYRLYQAVFGRPAEEAGLGYWISAMDTSYTLKNLADLFMHQKEFDQQYGTAPTDAEFVTRLYTNVLHRTAEGAGYDFWMNSLGMGTSRVDVIVAFSESAENQAQVIGSIQDGMKYVPYHVG